MLLTCFEKLVFASFCLDKKSSSAQKVQGNTYRYERSYFKILPVLILRIMLRRTLRNSKQTEVKKYRIPFLGIC